MSVDAVVVGSGPNGLAAAITLARAGRSVAVLEANDTVGGALRSAELTRPGFVHDLGSSIHPYAVASPFLRTLPLEDHGLGWVTPPASAAHPLDDGRAAVAWHDLDRTVEGLGDDGEAYRRLVGSYVERIEDLVDLGLHPPLRVPRHPLFAARFALTGARSAVRLARGRFADEPARALFAGHAAHSCLPLDRFLTASFGVLFAASSHAAGWPFPAGGAQSLTDALVAHLRSLGGEVRTGVRVADLGDLPERRVTILALTPRQILAVAGDRLASRYRRRLGAFRYGPAAFKVDYALDGPVPWTNADAASAATVHVGGTMDEVAESEAAVGAGRVAPRPFVLTAQHTLFDPSRAPDGQHTFWAYCHVPNGYDRDVSDRIDAQIERFAPGFRDRIIGRHVTPPADLEAMNANLVGGDLGGGSLEGRQLLFRPVLTRSPYDTSDPSIFIGSASTSPGGGVHGMGGHLAAQRALSTTLR